ncbi:hypothetical protein PVAND_000514 [Polypedilum vanderplanki]|uniref:Peptidase S1 domain-containing protein n=1 Tax=Polypedilum vanderplanki TaxID=319348 RepID=A0A9J6BKC4_POLVA|nr:hypothetical protein PVAND_000514 [Polypedilum vanderplanki]
MKLKFFVFLAIFAVISGQEDIFVPDFQYDVDTNRGPRIVGGHDANIEEVPYQVSLRRYNEETQLWGHTCGGIILTTDVTLNAAHCVYNRLHMKFQIRAGSDLRSQGGQLVNVTKLIMHPDYQPSGLYNDIAILKLQHKLIFGSKVWSIGLPPRGYRVPDGAALLVSGWGALEWQGSSPERLQKVYVPAVSNEKCAEVYANIRPHKICAGIVGKDSCQGDSGGPLVYKNFVVGVVSSGYRCAYDGYPGIYTRVSEFLDFIVRNL